MRTLGILVGMSWVSTAVCYRLLRQGVAQRQGGSRRAAPVLPIAPAVHRKWEPA